MEEKTTYDKIKEIEEKEEKNQDKQSSLWGEAEDLRKAKANLILQHFKEKKIFSLMTWVYSGNPWGLRIDLRANEDWNRCPEELVSLLKPGFHDHFYFSEQEEGVDEVETGIKMGLHFDDGDIHLSLEIEEEDDKNRMIDFLKKYDIKITAKGLKEEIKELREKIEGQEKIMKFVKEVNGR